MSTIQELFQQAQLAEAAYAYANLWDDTLNQPITDEVRVKAALTNGGFSSAQADAFLKNWRVVDQSPAVVKGVSFALFL